MAGMDDAPTAKAKIAATLRELEYQRQHLRARMDEDGGEDLSDNARLIELCFELLRPPTALPRRNEEQRRLLNPALLERIFIDHEEVVGHALHEPFALLHEAQIIYIDRYAGQSAAQPRDVPAASRESSQATSNTGGGLTAYDGVAVLLGRMDLVQGSSKPSVVG